MKMLMLGNGDRSDIRGNFCFPGFLFSTFSTSDMYYLKTKRTVTLICKSGR